MGIAPQAQHGLGCPREIEEEPSSLLVLEVHLSCENVGVCVARMGGEKRLFKQCQGCTTLNEAPHSSPYNIRCY